MLDLVLISIVAVYVRNKLVACRHQGHGDSENGGGTSKSAPQEKQSKTKVSVAKVSDFMFNKIPVPDNDSTTSTMANNNGDGEKEEDRKYEMRRRRLSVNNVDEFGAPISNIMLTRQEYLVNYEIKKTRKAARRYRRQQINEQRAAAAVMATDEKPNETPTKPAMFSAEDDQSGDGGVESGVSQPVDFSLDSNELEAGRPNNDVPENTNDIVTSELSS